MFPSIKAGSGARRIGLAIALAGTLLVTAPGAFAQSANDIIHGLAPTEHAPDAPAKEYRAQPPEYQAPPPEYRAPSGRGIEDTEVYIEGRHSRAYIDYAHAVDLTVYFEYNSDRVTDRARDLLDQLGEALASPQLRDHRFLIAGHTDAVGTDEFNFDLSYRRAAAVREYLARFHGIARYRLAIKGWGRRRLKDPANPESGINRRVEVALIVDQGTSYLDDPQGYSQGQNANDPRGRRPWFSCPPGARLIDPQRPDLDIDDFAAGSPHPMCRPID
jgi:outer membrane protein OmpA-like peptidoglycan-associated protein